VQGRLERLPQVRVLPRGEDVRLVHDGATDRVPELERPVGGDDPHRAGAVGIDELVSAHLDDVQKRACLDEALGEVEDDPRLLPRAGGAEDVRRVSPEGFRRQMRWLKRHGYHTITQRSLFNALMCGSHLRRKPIVITFDDGYRDVYRYASPVIERFGMHAISYLITERISGDDRSFLSWKQVRRFEGRGVEIGSHTVSHAALTSLSNAGAMDELVKSRKKLERKLDHRVPWLAYPYGDYDGRIEALAKKAGYKLAVTTDWGSLQSASRPFALKRLRVLDTTGVNGLAAMLGG
jgi:peptidoglycan/xylan/chitin deacetylase (PgdA/CDA1 family)